MIRVKRLSDGSPCGPLAEGAWVDVEAPTDGELATLKERYRLNPLALEDALEIGHWSRFERYPEHLFLILRTLETPQLPKSRTERVSYFYFPQQEVLLTFRNEPVNYLEQEWNAFYPCPPIVLWQRLLGRGVETFFEYVDGLSDRIEQMEEESLPGDTPTLPRTVFEVRREVLATRHLASQAREALSHLERLPEIGPEAYLFRDLTDRMVRVYEGLDAARESLSGALEVHLSAQNNRLNQVVQRLTVISTLFLPLTLWAGIYGTNVKLPEYNWPEPFGAIFLWSGLLLIGGSLAWWMKRQGWW